MLENSYFRIDLASPPLAEESKSMRIPFRILTLSILLAGVSALAAATTASAAIPPSNPNKVVKRAITFQVKNVDRSILPCRSDGAAYEVKGHLIGPAAQVGPG